MVMSIFMVLAQNTFNRKQKNGKKIIQNFFPFFRQIIFSHFLDKINFAKIQISQTIAFFIFL